LNILKLLLAFLLVLSLTGCAEITPPTPKDIITRPLGPPSVKIGMTKDEVKALWGEPDRIGYVEDKEKWSGARTEWVYTGRYSAIPLDKNYLSKTKKLYFDGESLTSIVEE
jgi:outer membrane biogenesis lipoprotein LolB